MSDVTTRVGPGRPAPAAMAPWAERTEPTMS
jgi:hypothetical protein